MSLRTRLIAIKADWGIWEDRLARATGILLLLASGANAGRFFTVRKGPTLLGASLSWLYMGAWFLAALLLRDRERWVQWTHALRWTAVWSILLALMVSAGSEVSLFSSFCTVPYALFISAYYGLPPKAWLYYALPLVQAVITTLLFRRLRKRKKEAPPPELGGEWLEL